MFPGWYFCYPLREVSAAAVAATAIAGERTPIGTATLAAAEEPNDNEGENNHPGAVVHGITATGLITRHIWIPPILSYRHFACSLYCMPKQSRWCPHPCGNLSNFVEFMVE